MKYIRYIVSFAIMVWLSVHSVAQVVYQCDFEEQEERDRWVLNYGPRADRCPNLWYMGKAANTTRDGAYGMFISDDGEHTTYSGSTNMYAVAVRELTLPEGTYTLFFDWLAKGRAASGEGIWVCWVPADVDTYTAASLRPAWVDTYRIDSIFNSTSIWKQGKVSFSTDGGTYKLAFVWTNAKGDRMIPPSGCVDNISIIPKEDECPPPTKFTRTMVGTTMQVSWQGDADWYDARVYDYESATWQYFDRITLKRINIDGLSEGMVQIYVRSHCGETGVSGYVLYTPFYFLPGRCINYLALDDPSQCTTYIGNTGNPQSEKQLVDSGYASIDSRHTLHYVPGETDPRTDNLLKTKPDDALASVRLGNWKSGAEAECIEYVYTVPEGEGSILKLRYSIVLNQPVPSHDEATQSSFSLSIEYREKGKTQWRKMPGGCGEAKFHVGYGDQTGWHAVGNGEVMWKEWTEVAVNLRDYAGMTIKVKLSTADCTAGGHYSYAYYTLDCESSELSGLNCGEDNPTTSFTAPAGFDYEWYLPSDPSTIISRDQTFTIDPMDTLLYNVDVISKTNDKCYYTLDACGIPRYPVAKAEYKWNGGEHCENAVTFYNQSYIYYKNIERWNKDGRTDTIYTQNEKVQTTFWDFGDGELVESNADSIVHVYSSKGGTFIPVIRASISNGACTALLALPAIELPDVSTEEQEVHLGKGSMYKGKVYWEPCDFEDVSQVEGCEVLTHVHIHETEFTVDTSFCEGGYFQLGDRIITESGTYKATLQSIQWPDVDSIVTLHLEVEPSLIISLLDTIGVCADRTSVLFPIEVQQGTMDSVHVLFSPEAVKSGFEPSYDFAKDEEVVVDLPDSLAPGYYGAIVRIGTPRCPVPDVPVMVQINYSSSIIAQKDGIIALLNDDYNGGYTFSTYRWYRNGVLIEGADQSYLVVGPDDLGAQYTVILTRQEDGVTVAACPIIYNAAQDVELVFVDNDDPWWLVDMTGRIVHHSKTSETTVTAAPGVYILLRPQSGRTEKIVIK